MVTQYPFASLESNTSATVVTVVLPGQPQGSTWSSTACGCNFGHHRRLLGKQGRKPVVGGRYPVFGWHVQRLSTTAFVTVLTLASACLPTVFEAVEIDGEHYWEDRKSVV